MSFKERMTADTHTRTPRWLYLLLKPAETIAIAVGLARLLGLSYLTGAWIAAAFYTALGIVLWYRHRRIVITLAPGQIVGDTWYHGLLSWPAPLLFMPIPLWLRWVLIAATLFTWWVCEGMGYGVVRNPDEGLE